MAGNMTKGEGSQYSANHLSGAVRIMVPRPDYWTKWAYQPLLNHPAIPLSRLEIKSKTKLTHQLPALQSCFPAGQSQSMLVSGVTPQMQDPAFAFIEFQKAPLCPSLQHVKVFLKGKHSTLGYQPLLPVLMHQRTWMKECNTFWASHWWISKTILGPEWNLWGHYLWQASN